MVLNPYTPGAGFMPAFLAGREELLENANSYLSNIRARFPQQSVVYYGLRGVGKTVLLNSIELAADNLGILYHHIEATEDGLFKTRLTGALNRFLNEISTKAVAAELTKRCLNLIKSFKVTYNIEEATFGLGVNPDNASSIGIFAEDMIEIFVALGKAALKSDDTICLFIDEIQYLTEEEINGIIVALHRCNQLRLPIMAFCAGLPKIRKMVGDACSYTERLFRFEEVDALEHEGAIDAVVEPARQLGVSYTEEAIAKIVEITGGYPYFVQEMCSTVWGHVEEKTVIDLEMVEISAPEFFSTLDKGFFSVRYDRCSHGEKSFMTAMVRCGELPCTISNVASILGKTSRSVSPTRAKLISKGMIYPTGHAEIDFTVPQFDNFIRRVNPTLKL